MCERRAMTVFIIRYSILAMHPVCDVSVEGVMFVGELPAMWLAHVVLHGEVTRGEWKWKLRLGCVRFMRGASCVRIGCSYSWFCCALAFLGGARHLLQPGSGRTSPATPRNPNND